MPIRVQIGNRIVEFPDGTTEDAMKQALTKLPPEQTGVPPGSDAQRAIDYKSGYHMQQLEDPMSAAATGFAKGVLPGAGHAVLGIPKFLMGLPGAAINAAISTAKGLESWATNPVEAVHSAYATASGATKEALGKLAQLAVSDPEAFGNTIGQQTGATGAGIALSAKAPLAVKPAVRLLGKGLQYAGDNPFAARMSGGAMLATGLYKGDPAMMAAGTGAMALPPALQAIGQKLRVMSGESPAVVKLGKKGVTKLNDQFDHAMAKRNVSFADEQAAARAESAKVTAAEKLKEGLEPQSPTVTETVSGKTPEGVQKTGITRFSAPSPKDVEAQKLLDLINARNAKTDAATAARRQAKTPAAPIEPAPVVPESTGPPASEPPVVPPEPTPVGSGATPDATAASKIANPDIGLTMGESRIALRDRLAGGETTGGELEDAFAAMEARMKTQGVPLESNRSLSAGEQQGIQDLGDVVDRTGSTQPNPGGHGTFPNEAPAGAMTGEEQGISDLEELLGRTGTERPNPGGQGTFGAPEGAPTNALAQELEGRAGIPAPESPVAPVDPAVDQELLRRSLSPGMDPSIKITGLKPKGTQAINATEDLEGVRRAVGADKIGRELTPGRSEVGTGQVLRAVPGESWAPDVAQQALLRDLEAGESAHPEIMAKTLKQVLTEYQRNGKPANSDVARRLHKFLNDNGFIEQE